MLSAGSFSSPYEHLSQPETKRMVEHYTAYLSDNTRLIANPGLKVCCFKWTTSVSPFCLFVFLVVLIISFRMCAFWLAFLVSCYIK